MREVKFEINQLTLNKVWNEFIIKHQRNGFEVFYCQDCESVFIIPWEIWTDISAIHSEYTGHHRKGTFFFVGIGWTPKRPPEEVYIMDFNKYLDERALMMLKLTKKLPKEMLSKIYKTWQKDCEHNGI